MSSFDWALPLFFVLSQVWAVSTSDYCRFGEELKQRFRSLRCSADLDECATRARELAQKEMSGSWGAVIAANRSAVLEERVDWFIHSVNPQPSRCRLLLNESIVLEVFRTGFRRIGAHDDQRQWIWREAKLSASVDICPHSALRELIAAFSLRLSSERETTEDLGGKSRIHAAARSLARVFHSETGHQWNVFITKGTDDVGLNVPHYVFDARAGFCIGRTMDGFGVNAAVIGFADAHEEAMSSG